MTTNIGTADWCASTTAEWYSVAAVPDVHINAAGTPEDLPKPSATNPALRSSNTMCTFNRSLRSTAIASGVDREPGDSTTSVTPNDAHSSHNVAQKVTPRSPAFAK